MRNKITSAADAVSIIQPGDTICTSGFVGVGAPEELLLALEKRFLDTNAPRDLTLVYAAGQGDGKDRGLNILAHEGLLKRVIGCHWASAPSSSSWWSRRRSKPTICRSASSLISTAISQPGSQATLSHVGLGTFVDPRLDGG